jgi:hypothetical protein
MVPCLKKTKQQQTNKKPAGCWWLTPVILATQKAEIRRIMFQSHPGQIVHKTYLEKPLQRIGLVEWLKV